MMTDAEAAIEAAKHGWRAVRDHGWYLLYPSGSGGFVGRGDVCWEEAFQRAHVSIAEQQQTDAIAAAKSRCHTPSMF